MSNIHSSRCLPTNAAARYYCPPQGCYGYGMQMPDFLNFFPFSKNDTDTDFGYGYTDIRIRISVTDIRMLDFADFFPFSKKIRVRISVIDIQIYEYAFCLRI